MPRRNYACRACGQSAYWSIITRPNHATEQIVVCAPFSCRTPVPTDDYPLLSDGVRANLASCQRYADAV